MLFDYTLIRSKRKSVSIQVDADCNITVRAPMRTSQKEIDKILLEKKAWLEKAVISQREKKKEIKEYSEEDIKELVKKNTRNYAKRQITFFKRMANHIKLAPNNANVDEVAKYL